MPNPHLTVDNLTGQLSPSPDSVKIQAEIRDEPHKMKAGLEAKKHVFAPGPARIWNAMVSHDRSLSAIRALLTKNPEAWIITAVITVGDAISAFDCARVRLIDSEFLVELDDACECRSRALLDCVT